MSSWNRSPSPWRCPSQFWCLEEKRRGLHDFSGTAGCPSPHPQPQKYLRFIVKGMAYQFRPFYISFATALQLLTRVYLLVPWSQSRGIHLQRYLDNWLILTSLREEVEKARDMVLNLRQTLGIVLNLPKSELEPKMCIKYLGMGLDMKLVRACPSQERIAKLSRIPLRDLPTSQEMADPVGPHPHPRDSIPPGICICL